MASFARHMAAVFRVPDNPDSESPGIRRRLGPLWLAVHFPWLAGEVVDDGPRRSNHREEQALAVSEESRRGWIIYRASLQAMRQGVCPGMTVSAASVVCPGLTVRRRRPPEEKRHLEEIGEQMKSFSPIISVQVPATVLIEVRGSLTLFRGLERLKTLIGERLDRTGHIYRLAVAPAPSAAKHLAQWGREIVVEEKSALRSVLGPMPIVLMNLDPRTLGRLEQAGIHTLRDLWRLPSDGLARRFGAGLVRELGRLQGRHPDPQPLHESPLRFSASLALDWATDDLAQIKQGVEFLLRQWVEHLRRSQRATSGFTIECLPERGGDRVRVDIGLRRITRDVDHLRMLCAERLDRVEFAEPIAGLILNSDRLHPFCGRNRQLFDADEETSLQWRQGEELLATRLGGRGLDTLYTVAEHRPERAWSTAPDCPSPDRSADLPGDPSGCGHRPLWLLERPRPLSRLRPKIITGPERIETGWWDRCEQRRDYYIATDSGGRRLWVYQDLRRKEWYLHGLFA